MAGRWGSGLDDCESKGLLQTVKGAAIHYDTRILLYMYQHEFLINFLWVLYKQFVNRCGLEIRRFAHDGKGIIQVDTAAENLGAATVFQIIGNDGGVEHMPMLAIVPGAPVGLTIVWEVQEKGAALLNSRKPVVEGGDPVVHVFQTVAAENIVDLHGGEVVGIITGSVDLINANGPWKFPFFLTVANIVAGTGTELLGKRKNELGGVSLRLEGWIDLIVVDYGVDGHLSDGIWTYIL